MGKIIVGISGGADSVALLHFLSTNGYECIAAHCNFRLRGEESDRDEQFVRDLCRGWNIPLEIAHFETEQIAIQRSVSVEMAARDLRYDWFEQLRGHHQADYIAVAHHRDDSIETFLLNIIRGTGIRGLTGISPVNGNIVRPFLTVDRPEIEQNIADHNLSFVTDGTNAETIYIRNKIRLELLPMLESINPSVREAIDRTCENLNGVKQIYLLETEKQRQTITRTENDKIRISISGLLDFCQPATLLFELLQPYQFNRSVCNEIFASLKANSGRTFYSPQYILIKDREDLIIRKKEEAGKREFVIKPSDTKIDNPVRLRISSLTKENFQPEKEKEVAFFDAVKLQFPLKLRKWQQSDWFVPFGMKGRKKVSDYFSDNKFDLLQKEETWLLCSGDDIIWIVGERSDNRYRVDADTTNILKIELTNH